MLYCVVLVAFATGWLWLGEQPQPVTLAGGAIALGGVLLVARSRQPRSPNPRSISSARSPTVPGRGSTPSATAAP